MPDSTTAPPDPRRLELRLLTREYAQLQRQAADNFRSPTAEARRLIVAGLSDPDNGRPSAD